MNLNWKRFACVTAAAAVCTSLLCVPARAENETETEQKTFTVTYSAKSLDGIGGYLMNTSSEEEKPVEVTQTYTVGVGGALVYAQCEDETLAFDYWVDENGEIVNIGDLRSNGKENQEFHLYPVYSPCVIVMLDPNGGYWVHVNEDGSETKSTDPLEVHVASGNWLYSCQYLEEGYYLDRDEDENKVGDGYWIAGGFSTDPNDTHWNPQELLIVEGYPYEKVTYYARWAEGSGYDSGPIDYPVRTAKEEVDLEAVVGEGNMFRLYNPYSGEHFYTGSEEEQKNVVSAGWKDEGYAWSAKGQQKNPVYRLYNANAGEHHYTLDAHEVLGLVRAGWKCEGVSMYAVDEDEEGAVPVYREYNPNQYACNHNYTTDKNEHDTLVKLGWKDEGIAWYVLPAEE